jgi:hypothetical protein
MSRALKKTIVVALLLVPPATSWSRRAAAADPTTADCLSASESSLRLRGQHKLRNARNQLLVCAAANCPADVRTECLRRVEQVNLAIPTLVFEAKDEAGNDLSAVRVTMDGESIADRLEGSAISLDPGEHTFHFEVEGRPAVDKKLVIHEGEKERHERIVLPAARGAGAAAPAAIAPPAPASPATPPAATPADATPSSWSTQKTLAVVAGGVGVAGLVVGGIFGSIASSKWGDAKNECWGGSCPQYQQAVNDQSSASSAATVSTIAFIVGGVAVAGGAVLWFTAPSGSSPSSGDGGAATATLRLVPQIGPGVAGVSLGGGF